MEVSGQVHAAAALSWRKSPVQSLDRWLEGSSGGLHGMVRKEIPSSAGMKTRLYTI
jgi:hypothetical protein